MALLSTIAAPAQLASRPPRSRTMAPDDAAAARPPHVLARHAYPASHDARGRGASQTAAAPPCLQRCACDRYWRGERLGERGRPARDPRPARHARRAAPTARAGRRPAAARRYAIAALSRAASRASRAARVRRWRAPARSSSRAACCRAPAAPEIGRRGARRRAEPLARRRAARRQRAASALASPRRPCSRRERDLVAALYSRSPLHAGEGSATASGKTMKTGATRRCRRRGASRAPGPCAAVRLEVRPRRARSRRWRLLAGRHAAPGGGGTSPSSSSSSSSLSSRPPRRPPAAAASGPRRARAQRAQPSALLRQQVLLVAVVVRHVPDRGLAAGGRAPSS